MVIENVDVIVKVDGKPPPGRLLSLVSKEAIAGAIGGCATRFLSQPFDVLKIRFQVQIEPIKKSSQTSVYTGVYQGFRHIVEKEGWTALWKGHVAAQALSISFGFFQFGLFDFILKKTLIHIPESERVKPGLHFAAGLGAGCVATAVSFPFDTIRTRLVIQGEPKVYKGVIDVVAKMWVHEGARSLYQGLWPALIQIGPYAGFQFASYKFLVELYESHVQKYNGTGMRSLLCGAVAGAVAKTLVYPLDLGKKRLQTQGFSENHQYKGLTDCLSTTVRKEGAPALLKGLSPSLLKALLASAVQFYVYELSLQVLSRRNN